MPAVDIGVRDAAEDGEVLPVLIENLRVKRMRVLPAAGLREELIRQQAKIITDADHPPRPGIRRQRGLGLGRARERR